MGRTKEKVKAVYLQSVVRNAIQFLDPDEYPDLPVNARRLLLTQLQDAMRPFDDSDESTD